MTSSQVDIDATPWKRITRRWTIVLGIMLALNGGTLLLGVCNHPFRASASRLAANAAEPAPLATAQDQPTEAGQPTDPPAEASSTSTEATPTIVAQNSTVGDATVAGNPVTSQASDSIPVAQSNSAEPSTTTFPKVPVIRDPVANVPADNAVTNPIDDKVDAAPTKDDVEARLADSLIIINPPQTGGVVHFLVDDQTISLQPGEFFQMSSQDDRRVTFHRGGDLSDAEIHGASGAFIFSVSEAGWELSPATAATCERLLSICRPAK